MTISVISSTLGSAYASTLLGPRSVQNNTAAQDGDAATKAGDASQAGSGAASSAGGDAKSRNFSARAAAGGQASSTDTEGGDATTQTIKQLQRQLKQVLLQIQRLQASRIPDEQKAPQLQALNAEAATLQAQIATLIAKQAQEAKGGVTA
ncbi:FlxA-like family protein [Bordetella bronchialis]|uniref:FlxA-like family protein n=1 Tax=Bordetella bronchialis TaxID=463025 RepID=UPI0009F5DC8B|nr:FlxA-like family protein [Bordetella bronchialis]